MHIVVIGIDMISRVYLTAPSVFNRIASIGGMLRSLGYLVGSAVGPNVLSISTKVPFLIMAIINFSIAMLVITVFIYRRRYLMKMESEFEDNVKGNYLMMEKQIAIKPPTSPTT